MISTIIKIRLQSSFDHNFMAFQLDFSAFMQAQQVFDMMTAVEPERHTTNQKIDYNVMIKNFIKWNWFSSLGQLISGRESINYS